MSEIPGPRDPFPGGPGNPAGALEQEAFAATQPTVRGETPPGPLSLVGWILYFAGNFVLAVLPYVGYLTGDERFLPKAGMLDEPRALAFAIAGSWVAFAVAAWLAWRARLTRRDLGLTGLSPARFLKWTALTLGGLLVVWGLAAVLGASRLKVVEPITHAPENLGHWLLWIGLALTAGTTEEFVMRGYGIGFWVRRGANPWVAAVAMSILFGSLHLYQGPHAVVVLATWGFIFSVSYLRTGSILPGVVAHAIVDGMAPLFL